VLAVFGAARTHQQNFPLFLAVVLGVSVVTVVIFVLTERPGANADSPDH
jgi:hypothetical protein